MYCQLVIQLFLLIAIRLSILYDLVFLSVIHISNLMVIILAPQIMTMTHYHYVIVITTPILSWICRRIQ